MARVTVIHRLLHSRIILLLFLFGLGLFGWSFGRQALRTRDIENQIANLRQQAAELEVNNTNIADLQAALETQTYLEREARLKLGLKKPGEKVVVVQDAADSSLTIPLLQETAESSVSPSSSNPRRWWYYFFDRVHYTQLVSYDS